ncbi:MAG: glutathione S-transferase N-terminal domain-containing protein [Proteobacteria bacterium]|nr:glutathione S-transferase N-terminal domain-containing protein [Pseudomonadota bacterium]
MKFYDCQSAPSPQRARIFIAEKGLEIETVEIDLGKREQLGDDFRRINPRCTVPVLELDDGTCLTENAGIAAYLEALQPDPPLLGRTAEEKGNVANWNARVELEGLWPIADALRNRSKGMVGRAITGPTDWLILLFRALWRIEICAYCFTVFFPLADISIRVKNYR